MLMKRILSITLWIAAMFVMASCSSGSGSTPGKALGKYVDELKSGNYENFVEGFALEEGIPAEQAQQQKAMLASLVGEKASQEYEKKGGLKGFEIVSEEIAEDGNSAVVTFKLQFGDGTDSEDTQKMVKRDGKWLMDADK